MRGRGRTLALWTIHDTGGQQRGAQGAGARVEKAFHAALLRAAVDRPGADFRLLAACARRGQPERRQNLRGRKDIAVLDHVFDIGRSLQVLQRLAARRFRCSETPGAAGSAVPLLTNAPAAINRACCWASRRIAASTAAEGACAVRMAVPNSGGREQHARVEHQRRVVRQQRPSGRQAVGQAQFAVAVQVVRILVADPHQHRARPVIPQALARRQRRGGADAGDDSRGCRCRARLHPERERALRDAVHQRYRRWARPGSTPA